MVIATAAIAATATARAEALTAATTTTTTEMLSTACSATMATTSVTGVQGWRLQAGREQSWRHPAQQVPPNGGGRDHGQMERDGAVVAGVKCCVSAAAQPAVDRHTEQATSLSRWRRTLCVSP